MEIWKKIRSYPYEVSNKGRVRRIGGGQGVKIGRIRKNQPDKDGYLLCTLHKNNCATMHKVHHLVAAVFIGPRRGKQINHKNGIKTDNRPCNLEYVTTQENTGHSVKNKMHSYGAKRPSAFLKEEDVSKIRLLRKNGMTMKEISESFGLKYKHVHKIVSRKIWVTL